MNHIDLNADIGESFGAWTMGLDSQLLPSISSANIACGWHAGDPMVMRSTVAAALAVGVALGAHPGYPDLVGFGRRSMSMSSDEVYSAILYQVGALKAFAEAAGSRLSHVKPHGALYNDAAVNPALARSIARAVKVLGGDMYLVGLPDSELSKAASELNLPYAREFFADRAYDENGRLVSRSKPGSVIHDSAQAVSRTLEAIHTGTVQSLSGKPIPACFDTICLHGDNPAAVDFARALRAALEANGIAVTPYKPGLESGGLA